MPKGLKIAVFLSAVMVMFASCGGKSEQKQTAHMQSNANEESKELKLLFPQVIQRDEPSVGGTFVFGYANDTPWKGVFNTFLYEDTPTKEAMNPMLGQFTVGGPNHELRDGGYCSLSFDREKKTATYHIHPKVTWSDGVPVTAEDIIFVYECIGHPDYTGVRYDSDYENVVGMVEYHKGEAKTISGVKKIDDKTVEVTFKNFFPGILWGAGITYNAEPAHYLKDIPLAQMASHDRVRKTPLACGPFVINSMIEGDLIEYVPNPYWFGKKPGIDKLIVKRITPTSVAAALQSGEIDAIDLPNSLYDQFVELDDEGRTALDENGKPKMKVDNIDIVGNVSKAYAYIGMKMGTWNKEKAVCEMFPDGGKFKDKALRHAIGYAMDNDGINDIYYHGLRITANSFITPYHPGFYDVNRKGYSYNPEKAKQLLDEAGYKDIDGDGYRETPDGKPLKINFLFMSGGDIAEPMSNYYIQNWKDVGLNVALNDGRLIEFNAFYDRLQEDDPTVELYFAAWGVGSNPDPNGFYNKKAQFNMSRQVSAKNDELLERIEEATVIPTSYRMTLKAVNKRVTSWDERFVTDWDWCDIGLTSEKPIVNTMK